MPFRANRARGAHRSTFAVLLAIGGSGCVGASPTPRRGPATATIAPDGVCPPGTTRVWEGRFDGAAWLASWDPAARFDFGQENTAVIADDRFGSVLRVRYPAGSSSSSYAAEGHPLGGAQFRARLPGDPSKSTIFVSYWVRFDPHFPWVRGGKLPGVCGGTCPSGGALVTGRDGWSARAMWRPHGAGEAYAYVLPPREYGTELGLGAWTFRRGDWHRLATELVLNDPTGADGAVRVWYDAPPGAPPSFEATGVTFRRDSTGATALFFSTFFGGHDGSWATPIDTFVDYADFVACR